MRILGILPKAPKTPSITDAKEAQGGRRGRKSADEILGVPKRPLKSSPRNKTTTTTAANTLQGLFDLETNGATTVAASPSPSTNRRDSETQELLSIISYCTVVFTFTDDSESPYKQDLKRLKLSQLLSAVKTSKPQLSDDHVLSRLFSVISGDLFRPLPPPTNLLPAVPDSPVLDDDADPLSCYVNPAWPHVHLVYDILLKLILNTDPKTLRAYIDPPFLLRLLSLFQTEDRRERECLKKVFHRIYSKFTFHRAFMRKAMKDVFLYYVFKIERHAGIGELLEIWGVEIRRAKCFFILFMDW